MTVITTRTGRQGEDGVAAVAAVSAVEGEIREFIRRDANARSDANGRKGQLEPASDFAVNNINSLLQRVSGSSVQEIESLIAELQTVRDFLQAESDRVQREIASYAHLSQAAMTSVKIIADSMGQWKSALGNVRSGAE